MQHQQSSVEVFFSKEYSRFKMINGNRQLNETKIKRIIAEIYKGNDMLKYYPIQVQENGDRLDILDGQHRFYICRHLQRPVYYILVSEKKSMPDIAKINSNVEKWKSTDFINCYIQHGNNNYQELQNFLDKYGISFSVSLKLLQNGNPGLEAADTTISELFKNGQFEVNHLEDAISIAEDCKLFESFPNWKSRAFVIAIYRIRKANLVSINDIAQQFSKRPEMLTQQANYKAYVNSLEQIINVGKQKRIVII